MRSHDNTLYVTTQKAYLGCEGTNICVRVEGETKLRLPIQTVGSVVCFGNVSCSPFLMGMCGREGVALAFLSERGRFLARVQGPQSGNVLLRRAQHRASSDSAVGAVVAQSIVAAKIANARAVLQRAVRDHGERIETGALEAAVHRLGLLVAETQQPLELERLRGLEGEAAAAYFGAFDHLIVAQKETFFFRRRSRRPPRDPMNAVLSFLYAVLTNDVVSACEAVGLDPQMGFLHADRPGRPSLALDLVEDLRPFIADRLALSLVNRQQVNGKGFTTRETGGVEMDGDTRKTILIAYQKRKAEEIMHPFLNEKVTVGLLPHVQARLLARLLRGDLDAYPAFFWK